MEISIAEVLEELERYKGKEVGGDGFRVAEVVEAAGVSPKSVRDALAKGLLDGTVKRSKRVIERLDGRKVTVTTYVMEKSKKPRKPRKPRY